MAVDLDVAKGVAMQYFNPIKMQTKHIQIIFRASHFCVEHIRDSYVFALQVSYATLSFALSVDVSHKFAHSIYFSIRVVSSTHP